MLLAILYFFWFLLGLAPLDLFALVWECFSHLNFNRMS